MLVGGSEGSFTLVNESQSFTAPYMAMYTPEVATDGFASEYGVKKNPSGSLG